MTASYALKWIGRRRPAGAAPARRASVAASIATTGAALLTALAAAMTVTIVGAVLLPQAVVPGAQAQTNTIIAVVNGEPVTSFDLEQRMTILLFTSGLPDTPERRAALEQRVIQTLVDERLKMQEAARLGIATTQEELDNAVASLERSNNLPAGSLPEFARQNGFTFEALEAQLRADLTWQKVVVQTERENVQVSAEQVDEVMDRLKASEGATEYRVAEILLLADERAGVTKTAVRELAESLVAQVRDGGSFSSIARQFSDSPSASRSGDLGWLTAAEMPPQMAAVVPSMSMGNVSDPVEEERGYRIYGLISRRLANATVTSDTEVAVRLLILPLPENPSDSQVQSQIERAQDIRAATTGCDDFRARAIDVGTPQPPTPTRLRLGDVNPQIRSIIASLNAGQISDPLPSTVGVQLIMVCEREITTQLPSRAEVQDRLILERAEAVSERRLRDLRRGASIEYR